MACALILMPLSARADADLSLRIVLDEQVTPYAEEMVLITVRGLYKGAITREAFVTPEIDDFAWVQLGRDRWSDQVVGGKSLRIFERRLALFPKTAGQKTIPPLTHRIELQGNGNQRTWYEVTAEPVTIDVSEPPVTAWWLPARRLSLSETWSGDTNALGLGENAVREVVLEASGILKNRLPPIPNLRTPEIFAFPESEVREMVVTHDGPISRVIWRWSILPETPRPAVMPPLAIGWFDTGERAMREAQLPPRAISVAANELGISDIEDGPSRAPVLAGALGLSIGLAIGAVMGLPALSGRTIRGRRARDWIISAWRGLKLQRAAAGGDAYAVRRMARGMVRPGHAPGQVEALSALDRAAYGPEGQPSPAMLKSLVGRFLGTLR